MDRDTADLRADQRGGDIKSGVDPETDLTKIKILQQGVTQMAHTWLLYTSMENEIMAPCDGTVTSVSVTKGAAVESGALLCTIG